MKKCIIVMSLFLIVPTMVFSQIASVNWNSNLGYAKKLAESKQQPMVLFFIEDPIGAVSSNVSSNILGNNLIAEKINNNFVPVLVKADEALRREYNISRTPTLLVLDNLGVEMDRLVGLQGIGIDQTFAMLENAQRNFESREVAGLTGPGILNSNTSSESSKVDSTVKDLESYKYNTGAGSFIRKSANEWIHQTSFYTVDYVQSKDDQRHYYIESKEKIGNEDKKVYLAVPKSSGAAVWLWKEEENKWVSVEEISIIEQEVKN